MNQNKANTCPTCTGQGCFNLQKGMEIRKSRTGENLGINLRNKPPRKSWNGALFIDFHHRLDDHV